MNVESKLGTSGTAGTAPAGHEQTTATPVRSRWSRWVRRGFLLLLAISLLANIYMWTAYRDYFAGTAGPNERFHSGSRIARDKLAVIPISGTISPPFTSRILRSLEKAEEDDAVKGVVLTIDSPGGLVTDSHQIYHRISRLREKKPVVVSMQSMACSGGYYVAMGAGESGKIFAEPTTWTGSIGVIIPRYDMTQLAQKLGVGFDPLKTGPFKDSLSPFRELAPEERAVWDDIIDQSYQRFLKVIDENRASLNYEQVKALATGRIFTADDAQRNGLIDEIGYVEDAIEYLKQRVNLKDARVVEYDHPQPLLGLLLGSMQAQDPQAQWRSLMELTVPKAMYYCSWGVF